jgi:hypothetical protein
MKMLLLSVPLVFGMLFVQAQNGNMVNAVLGDKSFIALFQQLPDKNTDETLRLQTHLRFVEALLSHTSTSHLSKRQKQKRARVLRLLHEYWTRGVFPKNYDYEERKPCFIDRDGNICAVGYLIEKTVGRKAAERINQKHQYNYLADMKEAFIAKWAAEYGVTLNECAMIQPTYGSVPTDKTVNVPVKTGYGIASGFLAGANAGVNVANLSSRFSGRSKMVGYMGLIGGASQLVLGLANIRKEEAEWPLNGPATTYSYKQQNNLSYLNIAAGTATLVTTAFNVMVNKRINDKRNAINMYGYPAGSRSMVAGLSFTRTL